MNDSLDDDFYDNGQPQRFVLPQNRQNINQAQLVYDPNGPPTRIAKQAQVYRGPDQHVTINQPFPFRNQPEFDHQPKESYAVHGNFAYEDDRPYYDQNDRHMPPTNKNTVYKYSQNNDEEDFERDELQNEVASPKHKDFVQENKQYIYKEKKPKRTYKNIFSNRKNKENDQKPAQFVKQNKSRDPNQNAAVNKDVIPERYEEYGARPYAPSSAVSVLPSGALSYMSEPAENQQSSVEQMWKARAQNLMAKKSGDVKSKHPPVLKKYPSDSKMEVNKVSRINKPESRYSGGSAPFPHRQPHYIAPLGDMQNSEPNLYQNAYPNMDPPYSAGAGSGFVHPAARREPALQSAFTKPVRQIITTDDGQRISVDINLKLMNSPRQAAQLNNRSDPPLQEAFPPGGVYMAGAFQSDPRQPFPYSQHPSAPAVPPENPTYMGPQYYVSINYLYKFSKL